MPFSGEMPFSGLPDQIQQFAVQLMTIPVLVIYVLTTGVQDSEIASEIPQGEANIIG